MAGIGILKGIEGSLLFLAHLCVLGVFVVNAHSFTGIVFNPALTSVAQVADLARQDKDFMQVAELYDGRADFDVANLVGDLMAAESVPCLPVLRYKPSGMDKRVARERTW